MVTESTGVLIPISIGNSQTFSEVNRRIKTEYGMRMNFDNFQDEQHRDLDRDSLNHFSEEEEETHLRDVKLEHFKESSSNFPENVLEVVNPTGNNSSRADIEVREEFHAVMEMGWIKTEAIDNGEEMDEEIAAFEMKPIMLNKNYQVPRSAQSLQFSEVILESSDHTSMTLLCRLCATQCEDMIFIFSPNEEQNNIIEMIKNCLPIMVSDTDALPKQVCRWCIEKLELCYKFRKTVAEAEKQLIMFDEKITDDLKTAEDCRESLPLCDDEKETLKADEDLECDEKTSEDEEEEYLPPKSRNSGISNSTKKLSRKDRENREKEKREREKEQLSEEESYTPSKTRSGKCFNSPKKKIEILCRDTSPGEEANDDHINNTDDNDQINNTNNNDHTYASQSDKFDAITCCFCRANFQSARSRFLHYSIGCAMRAAVTLGTLQGSPTPDRKFKPRKARPFQCSQCESTFHHAHQLEVHRKHYCRNGRTFTCSDCGRSFSRKWTLSNHVKVHTGESPFKCRFCDKTYQTKRTKDLHEMSHTDKVEFKCTWCQKTFCNSSTLRSHESIHVENRPKYTLVSKTDKSDNKKMKKQLQCDICEKLFRGPSSLKIHKKTQHESIN